MDTGDWWKNTTARWLEEETGRVRVTARADAVQSWEGPPVDPDEERVGELQQALDERIEVALGVA